MRVFLVVTGMAVVAAATGCPSDGTLPEMTFGIDAAKTWPGPPGQTPPLAAGTGRLVFTNNFDDTISLVDLQSANDAGDGGDPVVVGTVPVGFVPVEREGPHHVAANADGTRMYVGISNYVPGAGSGPHGVHGAGTANGHVLEIDVDTNALVRSVRIDRNPGDVRLTPDGKRLLASHFDLVKLSENPDIESGPELNASLAVVDVTSLSREALVPACPAPHGIAVTADSQRAVLSCLDDSVAIVDLTSDAFPVTHVPVLDAPGTARAPVCSPYATTIDAHDTAWVSCVVTGQLIAIDTAAGVRDGRVAQLQGKAFFGDVRDGVLAIAHQDEDGVAFVDVEAEDVDVLSTKLFQPGECTLPHTVHWSDDGTKLFVLCEGNRADPGSLIVITAEAPHTILGRVALGRYPDDLAIVRRPP